MPEVIEKPWGVTRCIHRSATCEVWHASIRKGGKSSEGRWHWHRAKHQSLYILSGRLLVEQCLTSGIPPESNEKHGIDRNVLLWGHSCEIAAGTKHRFEAVTDVELIETYWLADIDPDDIEREQRFDAHITPSGEIVSVRDENGRNVTVEFKPVWVG